MAEQVPPNMEHHHSQQSIGMMDTEMVDVDGSTAAGASASRRGLIQIVRSLDKTGPGKDGEHVLSLWTSLTSYDSDKYYAAEETGLRWLLKTMKGTNEAADTLRRYPLTWRVLDCAFQRIPLFSLAKSLADRKFMAILQQTLKAVGKPNANIDQAGGEKPKKRKRSDGVAFDLGALQTKEGCLATGEALLGALQTLFERLNQTTHLTTNDRMGAEHIKALFSQPASDVAANIAPILSLCNASLGSDLENHGSQAGWVRTLESIWNLRLQGHSDALEVATFLSKPGFGLLANLSQDTSGLDGSHIRTAWVQQLENFMHRNLLLPAKSAFFNRRDLEVPSRSLDITSTIAASAVPVFFHLATTTPRLLAGSKTSKSEDEWAQEIFKLSEKASRKVDASGQPVVLKTILREAISNRSSISADDLRLICNKDGLKSSTTDWQLVSLTAQCDPDVFLLTDDGGRLLDIVSDRLMQSLPQEDEIEAHEFLESIIRGFEDARDLSSFMKRWYEYLSKSDAKSMGPPSSRSVWYSSTIRRSSRLLAGLEKSMTTAQLLAVVEWLADQSLHPAATLVFLDTIASAVNGIELADALGLRLFELAQKVWSAKLPSVLLSLRWHIASRTSSWVDHEGTKAVCAAIQSQLKKVLRKGVLNDPDTFQAFQCATQLWLSSHPDGDNEPDLAEMLNSFAGRLADEVKEASSDDGRTAWDPRETQESGDSVAPDSPDLAAYVNFSFGVSSRFVPLLAKNSDKLPKFLKAILAIPDKKDTAVGADQLESSLSALFANEDVYFEYQLTGRSLDYVVETLQKSSKSNPWESVRGAVALKTLIGVPDELLSREQRESIMQILHTQRRALEDTSKVSVATWTLILGLMAKIARRPTFYEKMAFNDLMEVASVISVSTKSMEPTTALGLSRLIFQLSESTVKQMSDHFEEWGSNYFKAAAEILQKEVEHPLQAAVLHAVDSAVATSPHFQNDNPPFKIQDIQLSLLRSMQTSLRKFSSKQSSASRISLACHLEASTCLTEGVVKEHLKLDVAALEKLSLDIISQGQILGWSLRTFLIKNFPEKLDQPLPTSFTGLLPSDKSSTSIPKATALEVLDATVDAAISRLGFTERLGYVETLITQLEGQEHDGAEILAIHRILSQIGDDPAEKPDGFDLATSHSRLTQVLTTLTSPEQFCQTAEVLHLLLDQKASAMTQWNIESTMGAISVVCAGNAGVSIQGSSAVFASLCSLASVVIRRHRLRLDDHYHILLATMESLLRALVRHSSRAAGDPVLKAKHATMYSRLVTLITEPSAASVSRAQYVGALDSATDAAKRIAGRHVYLILMLYVKLQLEVDVPREVQEALEPGMNSIFDVTPPEVRKILNDAMDASGRAILRDMFKRYTQFGKWSGV